MRQHPQKKDGRRDRLVKLHRGISIRALYLRPDSFISAGDRIVVVVQKQRSFGPEGGGGASSIANRVRRGDVRQAVIVRASQNIQRADGCVVKFGDNACVLVNKSGDPIGTRLNGQSPVSDTRSFLGG